MASFALCFALCAVLALRFTSVSVTEGVSSAITLVHNDITDGQFCQVCKLGSDRSCVTIQSGESAGLDTYQLRNHGYFVSCPIGLTRAVDVEHTILEGLLKIDFAWVQAVFLSAHISTISKVNIVQEGASTTEVMRVVNPKVPASVTVGDP